MQPQAVVHEDFSGCQPGGTLPEGWQADESWRIENLCRPRPNREFWPAVEHPTMHLAFPTVCRDASGTLYLVYRQGLTHAAHVAPRDGCIMLATSSDGGETWSRPRCIFDHPDYDDRNAAILAASDGRLVVCFDQYMARWHWRAVYITSSDGGLTWSSPQPLGDVENLTCRGRPIELSDGRWLFPVYSHYGPQPGCYAVFVDPDTGRQKVRRVGGPAVCNEFSVCEVEPGVLLALGRSETEPVLWQSWSDDAGETWSDADWTDIPSQFAPADLIKLSDGRLACAFSFRERRNERLVISTDAGRTWDIHNSLDILDATVGIGDRSYVSSVPLDEHTIGSVIYETLPYPRGGRIWFARTDLRQLADRRPCLFHADAAATGSASLAAADGRIFALAYRFTGAFGPRPNGIELAVEAADGDFVSFSFWMGIGPDRRWEDTNRWLHRARLAGRAIALQGPAAGDSFNDGLEHVLSIELLPGAVRCSIDDYVQVRRPADSIRPARVKITVHRATVAVHSVRIWR